MPDHQSTDPCPFNPELNPFDEDFGARTQNLKTMRSQCPVHRLQDNSLYIASKEAVQRGLKTHQNFGGTFGDTGGALAPDDEMFVSMPEPRHGEIREILNTAIVHDAVSASAGVEPFIRNLAKYLVADTIAQAKANSAEVEIMASYGSKIPTIVIAQILGLPNEDFDNFARWSDEVMVAQGGGYDGNKPLADICPEFTAYLEKKIQERTDSNNPPDDVITRLINTAVSGESLTPRAIITQMLFFLIAGNETTRNLLGNLLYRLASDSKLFAQISADRSLIPNLVEESLRMDTPVQLLFRTCKQDTALDGINITEGERVCFGITSANRDEKVFDKPEVFDLDRERVRNHLAFGAGGHVCPGAYLARLEAQIAMEALFEQVACMKLAPGYTLDIKPVFWARGPQTLQVTLAPA